MNKEITNRVQNILAGGFLGSLSIVPLGDTIQIFQSLINRTEGLIERATPHPGMIVEIPRDVASIEAVVFTALTLGMGVVAVNLLLNSRKNIMDLINGIGNN